VPHSRPSMSFLLNIFIKLGELYVCVGLGEMERERGGEKIREKRCEKSEKSGEKKKGKKTKKRRKKRKKEKKKGEKKRKQTLFKDFQSAVVGRDSFTPSFSNISSNLCKFFSYFVCMLDGRMPVCV
jgi:hypothetical protein